MPQETDGGVYDGDSEPGVDASYPIEMDFGPSNYPAGPDYKDGDVVGLCLGEED